MGKIKIMFPSELSVENCEEFAKEHVVSKSKSGFSFNTSMIFFYIFC